MNLPTPIHLVSDLHLGHPASHLVEPEWLFPAFEGAASLVLNGDSCEFINRKRKPAACAKLIRLLEYCEKRGIVCVQLTGNHDPVASNLHHLDLCGGRVFVTHGDALHPDVAPWSREAKALRAERLNIEANEPDAMNARTTLGGRLLLAKRCALVVGSEDKHGDQRLLARLLMTAQFATQPWRAVRAARYWANVPHMAAELRERFRPRARLMLVGHSHRPGLWRRVGWTLVNTGSFQPLSRPLLAIIGAEVAEIRRLPFRRGEFRIGESIAQIALQNPVDDC